MKMLLFLQAFSPCWVDVVRQLKDHFGVDAHVLCASGLSEKNRALLTGLRVETLDIRSKLDFAAIRRLRQQLLDERYHIVQALTSKCLAVALQASRGLTDSPVIAGYRGVMDRPSWLDLGNWVTYFHPRLDGVMCISDAVREGLASSGVRAHLETVHLGESANWYARPGRNALAPWGVGPEHFVVGSVANIRPIKGIDVLLKAAACLESLQQLRIVVIGQRLDARVERLARSAELRERVILTGPRSDAAELASGFDVYVQPSRREGLCKALMAGMLQGACPVITRVGGMVELVRDYQDGLVVPSEDVTSLARSIRHLHDEPLLRQRLARSAQQRLRESFGIEAMAQRLMNFHQTLLDRKHRSADQTASKRAA